MNANAIGRKLRAMRAYRGLTLDDAVRLLAEKGVGTSRTTLSKMERGFLPSGDVLVTYAGLLGVEVTLTPLDTTGDDAWTRELVSVP